MTENLLITKDQEMSCCRSIHTAARVSNVIVGHFHSQYRAPIRLLRVIPGLASSTPKLK